MEQLSDIRNVLTPLSLGTNGSYRALWKQPKARFTSTPRHPSESQLLRPTYQLDQSFFDESLAESPILPAHPKVNLVFGRKQSLESDRLSISTGVLTTLGKMELCDNNNDSVQENLQKKIADIKKSQGESSSSIDAQEKFKKQLNKNKKKKGISPKKKSPRVYKIGLKKIVPEMATQKSASSTKVASSAANAKKKSPKHKSPKTYKTFPIRKIVSSSSTAKLAKDEHGAGSSDIHSTNKSPHCRAKNSELKMLRCAKSPKLRTAERALIKQHRDEIRKEKEKAFEMFKQKELEEQKRREEEEILKMRQQTLFKAHAIRKYAPLPNVKKRALTDPISPNLSKRRRIESSSQSSSSHASHSKI